MSTRSKFNVMGNVRAESKPLPHSTSSLCVDDLRRSSEGPRQPDVNLDEDVQLPRMTPWRPLAIRKARRGGRLGFNGRDIRKSPLNAAELLKAMTYWRSLGPHPLSREVLPIPSSNVAPVLGQNPAYGQDFPVSEETFKRILQWRQDIEDAYASGIIPSGSKDAWVSFLPSCVASSSSSSVSSSWSLSEWMGRPLRMEPIGHRITTIEDAIPEEESSLEASRTPGFETYETESQVSVTEASGEPDEMSVWPYDGRGLYEYHTRDDCGDACWEACLDRWQKKRRSGRRLSSLTRLLPWVAKRPPMGPMLNSDVPHPPWSISYRSNDDTLGEDEDDGDVELWLEHTTLQGEAGRELRSRLSLNDADSRIFSF